MSWWDTCIRNVLNKKRAPIRKYQTIKSGKRHFGKNPYIYIYVHFHVSSLPVEIAVLVGLQIHFFRMLWSSKCLGPDSFSYSLCFRMPREVIYFRTLTTRSFRASSCRKPGSSGVFWLGVFFLTGNVGRCYLGPFLVIYLQCFFFGGNHITNEPIVSGGGKTTCFCPVDWNFELVKTGLRGFQV